MINITIDKEVWLQLARVYYYAGGLTRLAAYSN